MNKWKFSFCLSFIRTTAERSAVVKFIEEVEDGDMGVPPEWSTALWNEADHKFGTARC
jgi:hypothetical protein